MRNGLVIFVKDPDAGPVKTRLAATLDPVRVTGLYGAFVLDTVTRMSGRPDWKCWIACAPSATGLFYQRLQEAYPVGLLDQGRGDLGARMQHVVQCLMGEGLQRVVLIGSDSPTLPATYPEMAFEALACRDVVVGPSEDGGYVLIGLSRCVPEIFETIPWSTPRVYECTLQKIRQMDLSCQVLPAWYDVDDLQGLRRLMDGLKESPESAPHTERFLQAHSIHSLSQKT